MPAPFAQFEIGQINEADQVNRPQHDGRADFAKMAQNIFIKKLAGISPHARRIEGDLQSLQQTDVLFKHAGQSHAAEQQDRAPNPAALQISQELKQIAQAINQQQRRDHKGRHPKTLKQNRRRPGPKRTYPVMGRVVGWNEVRRQIMRIIGEQRHHQQQSRRPQHDADDVVQPVRLKLR